MVFTSPCHAELLQTELPDDVAPGKVLVRTHISIISPGTERAVISDTPNCNGYKDHVFPRRSGYSSCGIVESVGAGVKSVRAGDRVIVFWGNHNMYNLVPESHVVKLPDSVSFEEGAMVFIASFSLAAIRKCRVEIGECCLVTGCGLLGLLALKQLKACGAVPVIAMDVGDGRKTDAMRCGADYYFDVTEDGFADEIRKRFGGANAAIEVTGFGKGLDETLDCMARFGRVALLGCTRNSDFSIDYYHKVHSPGITLIGAHDRARPDYDSSPGWFTQRDDLFAILRLLDMKRLSFMDLLSESPSSPSDCQKLYDRIIAGERVTALEFDWSKLT